MVCPIQGDDQLDSHLRDGIFVQVNDAFKYKLDEAPGH